VNLAISVPQSLHLAGALLDADDHELGRLSGPNPARMLTMPKLMSFSVVDSALHFRGYASRRLFPWNALARNRFCTIADVHPDVGQQRLLFGSNTTH
jgi:hypothetical protein